jgi:hypothetical protein
MVLKNTKRTACVEIIHYLMTGILERGKRRIGGEIVQMSNGITTANESVSQNRRHVNVQRYVIYLVTCFLPTLFYETHVIRNMLENINYEKNVDLLGIVVLSRKDVLAEKFAILGIFLAKLYGVWANVIPYKMTILQIFRLRQFYKNLTRSTSDFRDVCWLEAIVSDNAKYLLSLPR